MGRLQGGPLDTRTKSTFLASFVVKPLHTVLDLVKGLLLSVETLEANQVVRVDQEVALDTHIKGRVRCERGTQVHFEEPGLKI